jgi:hypothetical protein
MERKTRNKIRFKVITTYTQLFRQIRGTPGDCFADPTSDIPRAGNRLVAEQSGESHA